MKKNLTFRLLATFAVAMLFVGGAIAQTHNGTAIPGAAGNYADGSVQTSTYITQGKTVPVYALPDAYFHPSYNVGTSTWTLTDGFVWDWRVTTGTASELTFSNDSVTVAGTETNYTAITAGLTAAGAYTVNVREIAPPAYGGCVDAGTNLTINVVDSAGIGIVGGDATYDFCAGNAGLPANINTAITGGWEAYHVAWNLEIKTLDNVSADEFWYSDEAGAGQAGAAFNAVEYTTAIPQTIANAGAAPNLMTVASFAVINNGTRDATTVYTYTLVSINDRASRFGDFIGGAVEGTPASFDYRAATAASDVVVVTIHPAPVTGPIFHISNTWAN